jgi:cyclophilin family peptidyl-prolyl cis-trans isomerase/HEAT repeat protein
MSRVTLCLALFLGVLVGLGGCGPLEPPPTLGPERDRLALSPAEVDAIATLLMLEDHRSFDAQRFGPLLGHPSDEVRRRAVTAAGRIGDRAAVPLLLGTLARDPRAPVRADAAFALGLLGDTSAAVIEGLRAAAPRDWRPVRPEETSVVVEVIGALGRIGGDRARTEVVDALRRAHGGQDVHARRIAAEGLLAIWKFPTGAGRTLSAIRFLDHPDPELRWRAALAVVRLGEAEGIGRLLPLLEDRDDRVRALAARGLGATLSDRAAVGEAALSALVSAASDPHPHVRINALRSLASYGDRAPLEPLVAALRDRDANAAVAAAEALGTLGDRALGPLSALIGDDAAPAPVRGMALTTLAARDPDAAVPHVATWAAGDRIQRYFAARALAHLGWGRAGDTLVQLARDTDPRVAVAATEAAGTLAGAEDLPVAERIALREVLADRAAGGVPPQQVPALRGLASFIQPADRDLLFQIYQTAVDDDRRRPVAVEALRALGALQADDPTVADAFFRRFDPPADRWVRRAAAAALGQGWGAPPAAVVAEDLEFYQGVVRALIQPALAEGRRPVAVIRTTHGEIRVELLPEEAPLTVYNFIRLANTGFYDDGVWHRVVPNFVLQDGAPAGDPTGGPGWTIRDELNRIRYLRGILGMALAGPDTGGGQWFITHSPQPHLDAGYTAFGRVVGGEAAMDRVVQGEAVLSVSVR